MDGREGFVSIVSDLIGFALEAFRASRSSVAMALICDRTLFSACNGGRTAEGELTHDSSLQFLADLVKLVHLAFQGEDHGLWNLGSVGRCTVFVQAGSECEDP